MSPKQFHWCFTNALSREESDAVYRRYCIPGSARPFFQAGTIHQEVADACRGARVWGPSARFQGRRVGREHVVADGDTIEVLTR